MKIKNFPYYILTGIPAYITVYFCDWRAILSFIGVLGIFLLFAYGCFMIWIGDKG